MNIFDALTSEKLNSVEKAHEMGIVSCDFLPDGKILTASSD